MALTTEQRTIEAHAFQAVLLDAIHSRLVDRRWYRAHPYSLDWPTRSENEVILRELVKLARKARDLARPAVESDPVTRSKAAETWPDHYAGMPS